ncbi:MAG: ParB/RepB/Spo0J family partition protein [Candidatus Goldbacteria bacterium]|nr:ParB/RepB/Spo0J family partition protein [Candidatus Goldiibacteriota bacterium]
MTRQALGKGLDALIPGAKKSIDIKKGIVDININDIKTNPYQPRKTFSPEKLEELIKSVKEKGVIEPIIVKEIGDNKYELIVGERRFIAAQRAGLQTVPAIIKNVSSVEQLEIALIENIHREDLNPVEEALAYKQLMEGMHLTQEQLADKLGKNRATVANLLRILNLPEAIRKRIISGEITLGHAKVLLSIEDTGRQKALCEQVVKYNLSVRDLEKILKTGKKIKSKTISSDIPEFRAIEEKLKHFFGTKVRIKGKYKKGKIEIEYYSQEEFERILELLKIQI